MNTEQTEDRDGKGEKESERQSKGQVLMGWFSPDQRERSRRHEGRSLHCNSVYAVSTIVH